MDIPDELSKVQKYIDNEIQESLNLEYKASPALSKKNKDKIIKSVTSFANSDGGMIIYGVQENGHIPTKIDNGVSNQEINREWIDQILSTNITPPIKGIKINQIPLNIANSIYVVYIPKLLFQ